jgi:predicted nucleic acid-binding protein
MRYLLDTCVISELVAKNPSPKVVQWVDALTPDSLFLSVITIGEIQKGIQKLPSSQRKNQLESWLQDELLVRFRGQILRIDLEVMLTWGKLVSHLDASGQRMAAMDSLIAAIALHHNLVLVTRNEVDFKKPQVTLVNPWI